MEFEPWSYATLVGQNVGVLLAFLRRNNLSKNPHKTLILKILCREIKEWLNLLAVVSSF